MHCPLKRLTGLIQAPPRSTAAGTILITGAVLLLSFVFFSHRASTIAAVLSLLLVMAAFFARDIPSLHLTIFTAALVTFPSLAPTLRSWPCKLLAPLLFYCAVIVLAPRLRTSILWMRFGTIDRLTGLAIIATVAVSGAALILWHSLLRPDVSIQLRYMPDLSVWLLPLAGLTFAVCNAAMEEIAFRGVFMQALDSAFGPGMLSVLVQAWLFGAAHYLEGFPKGGWGLAMAAVYGIMLGGIRRRSRGILAPWAAHAVADLVIFAILSGIVLKKTGAL